MHATVPASVCSHASHLAWVHRLVCSGAIISLAWNLEGSSLVTAGEDGAIKQYSRTGNLRSKLAQAEHPVYCVALSAKIVKWKGHDGTVLKVDWNPITGLIVSGGEDKRFKVWDAYGQLLFASKIAEFSITSVAWAPSGEYFAVGSFDTISLCDKTGWTHSRSRTRSGSVLSLEWSGDGTHLAGAGANGAVIFGQVVDRSLEWKNFEIRLDQNNHVHVLDVLSMDMASAAVQVSSPSGGAGAGANAGPQAPPSTEELEFGHRVIEMSMGFDFLLIATTKQWSVQPAMRDAHR
jgi:WD40 repeat protein